MRCHSSWPLANLRLSAQHISHSPRQPGSTPLWSMWWVCRSVTRLLHPIYYFLLKCHCIRPVRCRTGSEPRWPLLHLPSLDSIAHTHPSMHRKCALPHHCTDSTGPWRPETPNTSSSASSSPISRMFICLLTFLTIISSNQVLSDRNRFYHISALCLRERVHPLYKKIDGAVITSKSENNLDCTITFQTDTILQKFMLRFEKLALDCNDHLYIYDGAHTIGNHKADLSCRSTRTEVGTIYIQSNFLTLRYTTDAYSKTDNGFRLIITAYKDSKNFCREHRCANQFCISRDLVCDGVNHCGDNSDESYFANCQTEYEEADTIIGLDPMLFVAIVSSVFVSCLVCVISVSVCLCRRERLIQRQQQRIALQQQYQAHQLHESHPGATPILGHNSYNSKLDGACTMITSLDYGGTRNGGIVNSYTHTALPNSFATLPHLHQANHIGQHLALGQQPATATIQQQQQQQHVRFGTLPVRGGEKPPPPYPGNYPNPTVPLTNGNGIYPAIASAVTPAVSGPTVQLPHSSQHSQPIQTQVIYTAK